MRLSPIKKVAFVFALMFAFDVMMILYAIADNGQQPPRPNVAVVELAALVGEVTGRRAERSKDREARIAALERQVAQQDQSLVLMQLMLGQLRQDLEEVRKHQKPTGLRYTQEVETATGDVIPGRWEWFVNFSEVRP